MQDLDLINLPDVQEPLQQRTVGQADGELPMREPGELAGDVGAQANEAKLGEPGRALGWELGQIKVVVLDGQGQEFLVKVALGKDGVDARGHPASQKPEEVVDEMRAEMLWLPWIRGLRFRFLTKL